MVNFYGQTLPYHLIGTYPLLMPSPARGEGRGWVQAACRDPTSSDSPDHLIRPDKDRLRNRDAEGLGGFQIHDQLELGRLLDRQICRIRSPEYLVDIARRTPKQGGMVNRKGKQHPFRARGLSA